MVSVVFIGQMLFPQYSHAHDLGNTKRLEEDSSSIILIKNSPQPIISDAGDVKNMSSVANSPESESADAKIAVKEEAKDQISEVKAYVLEEAKKLGLNPKEVELIVNCESTWNPKAMHTNRNGSIDAGLWQINSIHKSLTLDEKLDYKIATKWALNKRVHDGNWSAWYCARRVGIK